MGGMTESGGRAKVWGPQRQYLQQLYQDTQGLQTQQYGPSRVAGFDPTQEAALGMASQRAMGGSPLVRAGQGELQKTLEGQYLSPDSNPYLAEFGRRVGEDYRGQINALGSRMEASGRTGGGTHALRSNQADENLSRGLANLYGGAYEAERGRMTSGLGQVGALAEQDYRDLSALQTVGQTRQAQSQAELDDLVARFQQEHGGAERELLQQRAGLIGGPTILGGGSGGGWNVGLGCHVAAEYFGWFSKDWWYARNWILEGWQGDEAEKFRAFYLRRGAELAREIHEDEELREEWRPIFEAFVKLGRDADA